MLKQVKSTNRYKIAQMHPEVKWTTRRMNFADEWAASEWMYKNQLGRRNLTDEQRRYMIGKMYEARKRTQGGTGANQYSVQTGQNDRTASRRETKDGTAGIIGKEVGMSEKNVRRAERFAKGVDKGEEVSPGFKEDILSGKTKTTFADVASISNMEPEEAKQAVSNIYEFGNTRAENRELNRLIRETAEQLNEKNSDSEYTIDDLISELLNNANLFTDTLRNSVIRRKELIKSSADRKRVKDVLHKISKMTMEVAKAI